MRYNKKIIRDAVNLGLVDIVLGDNAGEQEKRLPHKIQNMKIQLDEIIEAKKVARNQTFFAEIEKCREFELTKMKRCFESIEYETARKGFVYH